MSENHEQLVDTKREEAPVVQEARAGLPLEGVGELAASKEAALSELAERSAQEMASLESAFTQSAQGLGATPEEMASVRGDIESVEMEKKETIETARRQIEDVVQGNVSEASPALGESVAETNAEPLRENKVDNPTDTILASEAKNTAFEKAEERRKEEYFNSMREFKEGAEQRLQALQSELEGYNKQMAALQERIDEHKSSFLKRMFGRGELKKLGLELSLAKISARASVDRMESETEAITNFDKILEEERALKELKRQEEAFLAEQEAKEKENRERSVENLMHEHNCFFIHSIAHEGGFKPSENNKNVSGDLDFVSQAEIVAGIRPEISASTIRPDTKDGIFGGGRNGIFLKGGRVLAGQVGDMGSVAGEGLKRNGLTGTEVEEIKKAISRPDEPTNLSGDDYYATDYLGQRALEKRVGGYNELVVQDPEVAGIYVTSDSLEIPSSADFQNTSERLYDEWWMELGNMKEVGVPLYVMTRNNHVFAIANIDVEKRKFDVLFEATPQDVLERGAISEEARATMVRKHTENLGLSPEKAPENEAETVS